MDTIVERFQASTNPASIDSFEGVSRCFEASIVTPDRLNAISASVEAKTIDNGSLFPSETYKELTFRNDKYSENYGPSSITFSEQDMILEGGVEWPIHIRIGNDGRIYFVMIDTDEEFLQAGYCDL
jgi:hypothetical protein